MSMTFLDLIFKGGVTLVPLGICSILVVAVVLERWWAFSHLGAVPQELIHRVESLLAGGNWQGAGLALDKSSSPFARVLKSALDRQGRNPQETADTLAMACDAELGNATRPLPILGTIGNIAPFIGLFGTVLGIMRAFMDVSNQGAAGATVVSGGIAEALIATAIGLGVGIVSVISNNWCNAWVEGYRHRLERFSTEWHYRLQEYAGQPEKATVPTP